MDQPTPQMTTPNLIPLDLRSPTLPSVAGPRSGRSSPDTPHPESSTTPGYSKRKFPFGASQDDLGLGSDAESRVQEGDQMAVDSDSGVRDTETKSDGTAITTDQAGSSSAPETSPVMETIKTESPVHIPSGLSFSIPHDPSHQTFHLPNLTKTLDQPRDTLPLSTTTAQSPHLRSYLDLESPTQMSSAGSIDSQATVRQGLLRNGQPFMVSPLSTSAHPKGTGESASSPFAMFTPTTPMSSSGSAINVHQLMERKEAMDKAKRMTTPMQLEPDKDFMQGPRAGTWTDAWGGADASSQMDDHMEVDLPPPESDSAGGVSFESLHSSISGHSSTQSLSLSERLHRLDTLGQAVKKNLERRPLPSPFMLPPPGSFEFDQHASASGSSKPYSGPLTPQLEAVIARADLAIGSSSQRPGSPGFFPLGRITPSLPQITRAEEDYISAPDLLKRLKQDEKPILVIDMRPLKEYLGRHLVRAVNLVVPSLIMRRCKRNVLSSMRDSVKTPDPAQMPGAVPEKGTILTGGWDSLAGFISTDVGTTIWNTLWQGSGIDCVLVPDKDDEESARVVEEIIMELKREEGVSIKWVSGGWEQIYVDGQDGWADVWRTGERSERLAIGNTEASRDEAKAGLSFTSGAQQMVPREVLFPATIQPAAFRNVPSRSGGRQGLPSLQIPGPLASASSMRPYPLAQGSLSAVEPYPSLLSPPPMGVSKPRRMIPTPIRIDTFGPGNPPPKTGRKPPALDLKTSKPNLQIPPPLKSASVPSPGPRNDAAARLRSASGNTTFPHTATNTGSSVLSPIPGSGTAVHAENLGPGTLHSVCHAQSGLPPSPSSFGGITRRAVQAYDSPHAIPHTGNPYFPSSGPSSSSSDSSGVDYPISPGRGLDDEDEERSPGLIQFSVSTILPSFLYLGPEITNEAEVQKLLDLGVKRILNVAVECDEGERLNLQTRFDKYVRLPLRDCVEESGIRKGVMDACQFLDDARLHSAPTYVHCKAGKSRSVTVVLGYLIHANAWTLKTSYAYVAERRKGISPNIGFVAELMQFEEGELGTKGTSGIGTTSESGQAEKDGETSQARRNRYARESLPPGWGSAADNEFISSPAPISTTNDTEDDTAATPRQATPNKVPAYKHQQDLSDLADQRGMNKEVRKNGQYVHFRRPPVNTWTLQPTRRHSKSGLEGLSFFSAAQLSPTHVKQREAVTPSENPARAGWL